MAIRAKFKVQQLTHFGYEPGVVSQVTVVAVPVYCGRQHTTQQEKAACESHSYAEATPSGKLELSITNPAAYKQFEVGQEFYFTLATPAES